MKKAGVKIYLRPAHILALGFIAVIIIGTILLSMPFASAQGESIGVLNAMFTSTSATCVTGLTVINPGADLSVFGKIILILLIQVGGLGFMSFGTVLFLLAGHKLSITEKMLLTETYDPNSYNGIINLTLRILIFTLTVELVGAIMYSTVFIPEYGVLKGICFSLFHSISAFCNAGFDILGGTDSLVCYYDNIMVNITTMLMIVIGGLGFAVVFDSVKVKRRFAGTLHTRVVLRMTAVLIIVGTILFLLFESKNQLTFGGDKAFGQRLLGALFQSITTRTAGFATVNQADLTLPSKFVTMLLMFIGASPASTGGGIKTTTLLAVILFIRMTVRGDRGIVLFKKSLNMNTVMKAAATVIISMGFVLIAATALSAVEQGMGASNELFSFDSVLYETISAFATVGTTTGITALFHPVSKLILIFIMYTGRIGIMTLLISIMTRWNSSTGTVRLPVSSQTDIGYPEGKYIL